MVYYTRQNRTAFIQNTPTIQTNPNTTKAAGPEMGMKHFSLQYFMKIVFYRSKKNPECLISWSK